VPVTSECSSSLPPERTRAITYRAIGCVCLQLLDDQTLRQPARRSLSAGPGGVSQNDQSTVRYRTKRTSSSQRSVSKRWKSPPPTQPLLPALERACVACHAEMLSLVSLGKVHTLPRTASNLHRRRNRTAVLVLPGCQRFGQPPRNKQGSSEGDLFIELAASSILSRATHYCKSAIAVPALSHQLPSLIALSVRPATLSAQPNDRTAACSGGHGEVRRMDANRVAVMRIQASYTARRYNAFFSVDSLHFVSSIVDQLATVVCIHVGDMGRPQITPLPGHSSAECVKPTAQLVHNV
jgi:hypothetical protein